MTRCIQRLLALSSIIMLWSTQLWAQEGSLVPAVGNIIYVDQAVATSGNGSSWGTAVKELADALKWANENKTSGLWSENNPLKIYVAKGTYKPMYTPEDGKDFSATPDDNRDKTFLMVKDVELYGGFDPGNGITELTHTRILPGKAGTTPNGTILSGDLNGNDAPNIPVTDLLDHASRQDNAYHVVLAVTNTYEKIIVKLDGFTITGGNANYDRMIWVNDDHVWASMGGGISFSSYSSSSVVLTNSLVNNNSTLHYGGGISNSSSKILSSSSSFSVFLTNSSVTNNSAGDGSGIYSVSAGGITSISLLNSSLIGNKGNKAIYYYNGQSNKLTVHNSIIYGNKDKFNNVYATKDWLGSSSEVHMPPSDNLVYKHSLVQGDPDSGNGNLVGIDPKFVDPDKGDYRLQAGSPLINTGDNDLYPGGGLKLQNDKDLAGNPRLFDDIIDIGPYENRGVVVVPDMDNNIIYVNQAVTEVGTGSSWSTATKELADALKWAHENKASGLWSEANPLKIYVAKGTYKPMYTPEDGKDFSATPADNRDKTFLMVKDVELYGGFDPANRVTELGQARILPGKEGANLDGTILSGDIGTPNDETDNAYHVVVSTDDVGVACLNGFSITGGYADNTGVFKVNSLDVMQNYGAGMLNHSSSPTLTHVAIYKNTVSSSSSYAYGGGMYNLFSSPILTNVAIYYNRASAATLAAGGGMYNSYSRPTLTQVSLVYNEAKGSSAEKSVGGGIRAFSSSPKIYNSIIWGNTGYDDEVNNIGDGVNSEVYYSLVQGSGGSGANWNADFGIDGTGNIDADPLFSDVDGSDFSLQGCSPAVNAGSNNHYTGLDADTKDLAGNPRVYGFSDGGIIDMGAYEFQGEKITYDNVLFEDILVTYNGTGHTIKVDNLPVGITATYEIKDEDGAVLTTAGAIDAGIYTVTVTMSGCGPDKIMTATLTINQATLGVTAEANQMKVYGEADPLLLTYTVSGYQGSDDETILVGSLERAIGESVGTYLIGQGDLSAGDNYVVDYTGADFEITKATLSVIAEANQSKVYGEADPLLLTYTVSGYQGFDDETILAGSLERTIGESVGTYLIGQGDLSAGDNYVVDYTGADFEITKATLSVIAEANQSKVYGEADPLLLTYTVSGYQGSDDETILAGSLERTIGESVGTYLIGQGDLSAGDNYVIDYTGADFVIEKAALPAFTFDDATYTYDGTAKSLKATGLAAGATVSSYVGNNQTNAGEYTVTANIDGGNNYEDGSQTATLIIKKAALPAFTFDDATYTYDGTAKSLKATGLADGATVSSYVGNNQTDAGEYTVTANIDGGNNYEDGSQTAKLIIKKAALPAFIFDDATFTYDGTAKSLEAKGLADGATVSSYVGNNQTNAGEYIVTANIDGGNNYLAGSQKAKLMIKPLQQVLRFSAIAPVGRDAGTLHLDISSNSELPILVFSDNKLVAEVQGSSEVLVRGVGQAIIRAEQAGDANYIAATAVEQLLEVLNDAGANLPVRVHPAVSPNGDGINEFLRIEGIEQYPENKLIVFDANGAVVQRFEGYNNASTVFDGTKAGRAVPNGTYFYVLEVKVDGQWLYDKGYFVVRK